MLRRSLLLASAASAIAAGAAQADTYCVAKPTCAAQPGGHAAASLPAAIADAAGHAGPDRIEIGPGTFPFPGATPTVTSSNDITEIDGAGHDETILTGGPANNFALSVERPGLVVSDLGLALPDGVDSRGLNIEGAGAVARRIDVEGPNATGSSQGVGVTGGATLEEVHVTLATNVAAQGVYVYGSGGATLSRVRIRSGYGLRVNSGNGQTDVQRSRITAQYIPAHIQNPNELAITDSLVTSLGAYEAVSVSGSGAGTTTTARISRSTLAGGNGSSLVRVSQTVAGGTARAILRGVAVVGNGTPFSRQQTAGTALVDVDYSAFATGYVPGPSDTIGSHNLGVPSGFVDPAQGDYRPRHTSPLVDAGGTAALPPTASDAGGGLRVIDGNGQGGPQVDIGAFEYQRRPPTFTATASAASAPLGSPLTFLMGNVVDADPGEVPTVRWEFSDGVTVQGASAQHAFGAAGAATAKAVAVDPAGAMTTQTFAVDVTAPAAPGSPSPGGTATPGTGSGGSAKPGAASKLRVGSLRLGRDGRVRALVRCDGPRDCKGRLAVRALKGKQRVALGSKAFTLKAGAARTVALKLGRAGRAALPSGRKVRIVAVATGRDAAGATLTSVSAKATVKRR